MPKVLCPVSVREWTPTLLAIVSPQSDPPSASARPARLPGEAASSQGAEHGDELDLGFR